MSENKLLVAFDLSDQCVRAAIGRAHEEQIEILAIEQKNYRQLGCLQAGVVKKASEVAYALRACALLLQNRINTGVKITSAFVSIGGQGMRTIRIVGKRESGGALRVTERLMKDLLKETIQKTEEKYKEEGKPIRIVEHYENRYWIDDIEKEKLIEEKGKKIEIEYTFVIIPTTFEHDGEKTIERNCIKSIEKSFAQAGLQIEQFFLKSDALSTALLEEDEKEKGCALIDFGCGSTSISIYQKNKPLFTGCIPIGGKHITADISSLGISFENAEKLKCKFGQALQSAMKQQYIIKVPAVVPDEEVRKIDTQVLNHIIETRQRQALSPIVKQIKTHNVEHLIITGEAAKLRDLDTLLYEETALKPRIGTHDVWIKQGLENHPINSLLVGTLILGSCYRKEHPNTEPAKPIIPPNIKNKAKAFMDKLFT